ncbi:MAG: hypothetical protein L3J96_01340 [Thermoplasmata archaeon]|nr:hypothetical protein [Thermoplasmata archaeon]
MTHVDYTFVGTILAGTTNFYMSIYTVGDVDAKCTTSGASAYSEVDIFHAGGGNATLNWAEVQ